jgi:hypothetical protein
VEAGGDVIPLRLSVDALLLVNCLLVRGVQLKLIEDISILPELCL